MMGRSIRNIEFALFEKANEEISLELAQWNTRADQVHNNPEDYEEISQNLRRFEEALGIAQRKRQAGTTLNVTILNPYPNTKGLVVSAPSKFVFELLGDGRDVAVADMITLATQLDLVEATQNDVDTFLSGLMAILVNQTLTNPAQYVSHGADHSVRVMNWAKNLIQIDELAQGMRKYGLSNNRTLFALSILGIIHDIGYNDVDAHSVSKWLHAVAGATMTQALIDSGKSKAILCAGNEEFCADFVNAVKYHNFDESYCLWTTNARFNSTCTFMTSGDPNNPASGSTPLLPPGSFYTRSYVRGSTSTSPLHFVVRVADNLDAIRTRLTPVQNDAAMMKYFYRLYVDFDLRQQFGISSKSDNYTSTLAAAKLRAQKYSGLTAPTADQTAVMSKANGESFLHFYSNWIVKDSVIDSENWLINVNFWEAQPPLNFNAHIGAALFQINRFASSAVSLSVNGGMANFADVIRVSFNSNSGIGSGGFLPLKAFTQKPVYNVNGTSVDSKGRINKLCSPYCNDLTIALTESFEKCLDANELEVSCDNSKFALLQPYDSLNYDLSNPSTGILASTMKVASSANTNAIVETPKKEDSTNKPAIIVGVVLGVAVLVLIVVVIIIFALGKKGKL